MQNTIILSAAAVGSVEVTEVLPNDGSNTKLIIQLAILIVNGVIAIIQAIKKNKKQK